MTHVSVIIPFYRRHANLARVLKSLSLQTMGGLEVIVAAFEPDCALKMLCSAFDFAVIVPVSGSYWNVAAARNAGMRAASGELLIFLDTDIVVREEFISYHVACHTGPGSPCLSVGRVLGFFPYGKQMSGEAERLLAGDTAELLAHAESTLPSDARWGNERGCALPWAFCWSGNIGVASEAARRHSLYFDENFQGWGGEDLEWAYRAHRAGQSIKFLPEAWGVHLPHERNVQDQISSEQANFRRFLARYPTFEVELVVWLNDLEANSRYSEIVSCVTRARGMSPVDTACPVQVVAGGDQICFGAEDTPSGKTAMNLLGVTTPFPSGSFQSATIAPWMRRLPSDLFESIEKEADRLCRAQ
jgi:GT2 family glycosyltransferase